MKRVDPIAEESEMDYSQHPAKESPGRWQPCLKHPTKCGAHQRTHHHNPKPRVLEEQLPRRHGQSLRRKVHGHISGLHVDVDGFEMFPHIGSGIGKSSVRESISCKKEAEIIRDKREKN